MGSIARPYPPESLFDDPLGSFRRAPEVEDWLRATFIDSSSPLYGEEHEHLEDATIGVLWRTSEVKRKGVPVTGTAVIPDGAALHGEHKQMFLWQMRRWFANLKLDFLITLYAPYAEACADIDFCALVKHELCHCAQAVDEWGGRRFRRDGSRLYCLIGHDVEEHIAVVRDFGAVGRNVREFVAAASAPPRIGQASIARMCGTLARAA